MGWRDEVEARIAEMENYRLLQQEARRSARSIGGPEAEHLEAQVENVIRKVSKRVNDLRASLEKRPRVTPPGRVRSTAARCNQTGA